MSRPYLSLLLCVPIAAYAARPSSDPNPQEICRINHGGVEWTLTSGSGGLTRGDVAGLQPDRTCNNHTRLVVVGTRAVTVGMDVDFELNIMSGVSCHVADAVASFDIDTGDGLVAFTDRTTGQTIEYLATLSGCLDL